MRKNENNLPKHHRKTCLICNNTIFKVKVKTNLLIILSCCYCSFYQVEWIYKSNNVDYYKNLDKKKYLLYYGPFRKKIFKSNWRFIEQLKSHEGTSLDIGSSFGWFLEVAPLTWRVKGIDPSSIAILHCRKKRFNVSKRSVRWIKKSKKKYDLITLWNVIEHLENPKAVLEDVNKKLNANGIIGLAFPNRKGLFNRLAYSLYYLSFGHIKNPLHRLFQVGYSTPHVYHFSENDMEALLRQTGFTIIKKGKQPIIDVRNLTLRSELESNRDGELSIIGRIAISAIYYLSLLMNMLDEIVIYAKK